jgi:endoglucanase
MTNRNSLVLMAVAVLATVVSRRAAAGPVPAQREHVAVPLAGPLPFTGVNLAGTEFGQTPKPGTRSVYAKDYIYPSQAEFDAFAARGMNVFWVPFLWERLQPAPRAPLDPPELDRRAEAVRLGTRDGGTVILDPHNYARYHGKVIGEPEVPLDDFADFWVRLATCFKGNPRVWFGLVNEPHDLPNEQWLRAANAAIAAIRTRPAR